MSQTYLRATNSFSTFLQGNDIAVSKLSSDVINGYAAWLTDRGIVRNTLSFYMRILRSAYNKAVENGYCKQKNPFKDVYTGVDKTVKRAVDENVIQKLCSLNLSSCPHLSVARDIFMFSYFTRGMAFVDIAYLKKKDIHDSSLSYIRKKTGQKIIVHIEPAIKHVIDYYSKKTSSPYVFPIISSPEPSTAYLQYQSGLSKYNKQLKKLANMLGDGISLSSYTSRHSWASAAQKHQVPISIISAGMGHTSETTTRIYLASLDNSYIDQANRKIISQISFPVSS